MIEVRTATAGGSSLNPGTVSHGVRGEAAAVDAPGGQTMFALLRSDADNDWASRALFMAARTVPFSEVKDLQHTATEDQQFDRRMEDTVTIVGVREVPRHYPELMPAKRGPGDPPTA